MSTDAKTSIFDPLSQKEIKRFSKILELTGQNKNDLFKDLIDLYLKNIEI